MNYQFLPKKKSLINDKVIAKVNSQEHKTAKLWSLCFKCHSKRKNCAKPVKKGKKKYWFLIMSQQRRRCSVFISTKIAAANRWQCMLPFNIQLVGFCQFWLAAVCLCLCERIEKYRRCYYYCLHSENKTRLGKWSIEVSVQYASKATSTIDKTCYLYIWPHLKSIDRNKTETRFSVYLFVYDTHTCIYRTNQRTADVLSSTY